MVQNSCTVCLSYSCLVTLPRKSWWRTNGGHQERKHGVGGERRFQNQKQTFKNPSIQVDFFPLVLSLSSPRRAALTDWKSISFQSVYNWPPQTFLENTAQWKSLTLQPVGGLFEEWKCINIILEQFRPIKLKMIFQCCFNLPQHVMDWCKFCFYSKETMSGILADFMGIFP